MKRFLSIIVTLALVIGCGAAAVTVAQAKENEYIDNSSLLPAYVEDSQVKLEVSGNENEGELYSPDWVKTLIIAELNIEVATPEGTFDAAIPLLDHYAETGVNGIWLTPIFDDDDNSSYGNFGVHTISKRKTGCDNYEDGFLNFKHFVDEAHSRNIRVFIDIVTWGCDLEAPMYNEHPDWFSGYNYWGGWTYNFTNEEFYEYFVSHLVWWTSEMGVDGFRCDCEPGNTGYTMFKDVRVRALEAGEKICIFSESTNERFNGCYDFDEHSSGPDDWWSIYELFTERYDLMDAVKKGIGLGTSYYQLTDESSKARFYAYLMSCHDTTFYGMNGKMSLAAYEGLMSPFIPIFFMGEEFNNSVKTEGNMYLNRLELSLLDDPEHRAYFEEFKSLIRIRRQYPEIFNEFPNRLRDAKIEEVEVIGLETLQGYVRYNDDIAIIVIGNNNVHTAGPFTVRVPYQKIGFEDADYQITDLLTNKVIATGNYATMYDFKADIAQDKAGIYLLSKVGDIAASERHNFKTYEELAAAIADAGQETVVKPDTKPANETKPSESKTDTKPDKGTKPSNGGSTPSGRTDEPVDPTDTGDNEPTTPEETEQPTGQDQEPEEVTEKIPVQRHTREAVEVEIIPTWLVIVIIAAAVLIVGGIVCFIILRKRGKNKAA